MYLIVGLGNPEPEYSRTRHNMGFDVINKLSENLNIKVNKNKFNSLYGTGTVGSEKIILLKPQTYMNLSGNAVRDFMNFYKISSENIIIVYDDLDIQPGIIKIRKKGGSGTHNGMKSVVHEIQTEEFPRIRIGTGFCKDKSKLIEYVISKVSNDEYIEFIKIIDLAKDALASIIKDGIDEAMNRFN